MKKIFILFLSALIVVFSCEDEDLDPRPDLNENVGAITLVEVNPDKNFFNFLASDFAAEEVEFSVDVDGFDLTDITSVEVELVYTDLGAINDPLRGGILDSVFSPVVVEVLSTFPGTVNVTASDVAQALNLPLDSLQVGDRFQITLPINTADGRRLTTALASDLCNQPAQPSFGGCGVAWGIACPSAVPAGTWTTNVSDGSGGFYVIEVTDNGGGSYSVANMNLDYQPAFYGTFTSLPIGGGFTDVCNTITFGQPAEFGVTWSGTGIYDPNAQTITLAEINDPAFGQGPWDNGGAGFVFTKD
ncbi:MAG: hypothetical protein AAGF85_16350 [Bacteroidota bacterium]